MLCILIFIIQLPELNLSGILMNWYSDDSGIWESGIKMATVLVKDSHLVDFFDLKQNLTFFTNSAI